MMNTGTPLVLRRYQIDESGASGANVWIEARQGGFFNFLLTLVGLDPNSSLTVSRGSIAFRTSSVFGSTQVSTPLTNIGAFIGGYKKPFFALVFGIFFIFFGVIGTLAGVLFSIDDAKIVGIIFLVLGGACLLYYYLQKTMYVGFETNGGGVHGFAFKASLIEGVNVNIQRVLSTIDYVNSLISSATLGETVRETSQIKEMGSRTATIYSAPMAESPKAVPDVVQHYQPAIPQVQTQMTYAQHHPIAATQQMPQSTTQAQPNYAQVAPSAYPQQYAPPQQDSTSIPMATSHEPIQPSMPQQEIPSLPNQTTFEPSGNL